jgi:hypothetical protein
VEAPYAFLAPYIIIKEAMQKPSYKTQQRISLKCELSISFTFTSSPQVKPTKPPKTFFFFLLLLLLLLLLKDPTISLHCCQQRVVI